MASPLTSIAHHTLVSVANEARLWEVPVDRSAASVRALQAARFSSAKINCVRWNHSSKSQLVDIINMTVRAISMPALC